MAAWSNIIGKFSQLTALNIKTDISRSFYLAVLHYKDILDLQITYDDENDNPNRIFETLEMALNPRKGEDKYVYYGTKKSKDKETGITVEESGDLPMKKFVTITVEAKVVFIFILCAFVKECKDYYDTHQHIFPNECDLVVEMVKFSKTSCANHVIAFIIKVTEMYNIEKFIKNGHFSIEKKLSDKARQYFKDKMDKKPDSKITMLIEIFVKFLNVLACMSTNVLYEKRQAINMAFMFGLLRILSTFTELNGTILNPDIFTSMKEYVDSNKPIKKKKGEKNDDDEENEEEDFDEEEVPKKKKASKKKKAASKKKSLSKKKESDDNDDDDVEKALDDEQWHVDNSD